MLQIDENQQKPRRRKRFERLSQKVRQITAGAPPAANDALLIPVRAAYLHRNAPAALLANLVAGVICMGVLIVSNIGTIAAASWATLLLLSVGFFYFVWRGYSDAVQGDMLKAWMARVAMAYCAVGVIWALSIAHLFRAPDTKHLVVIFLLAGTSAAAVASAAAYRTAVFAFTVPVFLALGAYFVRGPTLVEWMLAGFALAYFAFNYRTVTSIEASFVELAALQEKNRQLLEALDYAVAETREREDENRIVSEAGQSWEAWFGAEGKLRWLNGGVERITGYTVEECQSQRNHPLDIIYPEDRDAVLRALASAAVQPKIENFEFRIVHKDGSIRVCALELKLVSDSKGRKSGFRISIWDISDRKTLEEQVEISVATDALTGLVNRSQFFNMAYAEIDRATRHDRPTAVALIDIDRFSALNDRYGNDTGDECLRVLAHTVLGSIRETDIFGRYGGEEFSLLLTETQIGDALRFCERLRQVIEQLRVPVAGETGTVSFTVSIGLVDLQTEGEGVDQLIARADAALRKAKANGRNQVAYGDPNYYAPSSAAAAPGPSAVLPLFRRRAATPLNDGDAAANTSQAEDGSSSKARGAALRFLGQ